MNYSLHWGAFCSQGRSVWLDWDDCWTDNADKIEALVFLSTWGHEQIWWLLVYEGTIRETVRDISYDSAKLHIAQEAQRRGIETLLGQEAEIWTHSSRRSENKRSLPWQQQSIVMYFLFPLEWRVKPWIHNWTKAQNSPVKTTTPARPISMSCLSWTKKLIPLSRQRCSAGRRKWWQHEMLSELNVAVNTQWIKFFSTKKKQPPCDCNNERAAPYLRAVSSPLDLGNWWIRAL